MRTPPGPPGARRPASRGFTLLELVLAMAVFSILAGMVVYFMRQGLDIFAAGTQDTGQQDRIESVVVRLERYLPYLALPPSFDPPPPPPTEEDRMAGREFRAPPPVDERLRSGFVVLTGAPEALRALPCPYFAFTVHASAWPDTRLLASTGKAAGKDAKRYAPGTVDTAGPDDRFLDPSGLVEVCYLAVPEDEKAPALLTLYHGFRAPAGGPGSLLDPTSLDTFDEIRAACRPIGRVLHLETRWRRTFALDWNPTSGAVGETDPYVGTVWDSTRAHDRAFPLHVGPESLGDPSDDVFPAWVRITVTVPPREPPDTRGDTPLADAVAPDAHAIFVDDVSRLLAPGPEERYLKVGPEWMRYAPASVDAITRRVPVTRGVRGTKATGHAAGAWVHLGQEASTELPLVHRDRFARRAVEGRR